MDLCKGAFCLAAAVVVIALVALACLLRMKCCHKVGGMYGGSCDGAGDDYDYDYGGGDGEEGMVEGGGPFRLSVREPRYAKMQKGEVTIEPRPDNKTFSRLKAGDPIMVIRSRPRGDTSEYPGGEYKFEAEVVRVDKYPSISDLLEKEKLAKVYPGDTKASATAAYHEFTPESSPAGCLAIEFKKGKAAHKSRTK